LCKNATRRITSINSHAQLAKTAAVQNSDKLKRWQRHRLGASHNTLDKSRVMSL